jgi:hypothetical protein
MTRHVSASATALSTRPRHRIRRFLFSGFVLLLLMGVVIQFIPFGGDLSNPPVRAEPAWNTAQTRALFVRACGDCHSNQTVWPWYSSIAPISWLVIRDVQEAREKFNVSEWDRSDNEGDEAAEQVQDGSMPPLRYLLAHPSAHLSPDERQALIDGLVATFGDKRDDDSKRDDD